MSVELSNDLRLCRLEARVRKLEMRSLDEPPTLSSSNAERPDATPAWPIGVEAPLVAEIVTAPEIERPAPAVPTSKPELPAEKSVTQSIPLGYQSPEAEKPVDSHPLEQTLGLKWTGWVGAVVLIVGGALGVKFIYDNGWFSIVPAWLRLACIFAAGFSLIALGELVLRKVHAIPAACLFGAGVATLFVAGYTGNVYFELYNLTVAQGAMMLATLIGAAIAMRANFVSIGVLALIGGNVAPLIVGRRDASIESFLIYLLILQAVALFLAHRGSGGKWWTLRGVSLATMTIWIGSLIAESERSWLLPATMLLSAAAYELELIGTSLRRGASKSADQTGALFCLFLAAALTTGGLCYLADASRAARTEWVLLLAALFGGVGAALNQGPNALAALARSHRLAGVALLALALPVAVSGDSLLMGWGMLATLLAVMHRRGGSSITRYASAGTWFVGIAYAGLLLLIRFSGASPEAARLFGNTFFDVQSSSRSVGTLVIAAVGFAVGRILSRDPQSARKDDPTWNALAESISAVATFMLAITSWLAFSTSIGAVILLGTAWCLLLSRRWLRPLEVAYRVLILLLVSVMRLVWSDVSVHLLGHPGPLLLPIVNTHFALYALLMSTLAAMYRLDGERLRQDSLGHISAAARDSVRERYTLGIAGLAAWALSVETLRFVASLHRSTAEAWHLQSLLLSSVWLTAAFGTVIVLRKTNQAGATARIGANFLAPLVIVAALKYLIADTIAWRLFYAPLTDPIGQIIEIGSAAMLVASSYRMSQPSNDRPAHNGFAVLSAALMLWAGSVQLDRAILGSPAWLPFGDPHLALLVLLSVFWAIFAVAAIITGFARRLAALRYFGLGLLGATLLKVMLIDLSSAGTGYRIVSFIGLGAVLIGTSVVYGKVSPRLRAAV